jgi:TrmH family RNA methyltransferase
VHVPSRPRITSRQHEVVRRIRAASRHPAGGVVVLDGEHLVVEALDARLPVEIVLSAGAKSAVVARAQTSGALVYDASDAVIGAASPVRTPSGIVALTRWAPVAIEDAFRERDALVLGLVDVQDPGNAGSAIRAADALGATAVAALGATAHPGGWKALRGAMGSTFHLAVARGETEAAIAAARGRGLQILATVAGGGTPVENADFRKPTLVLLGGEGAGLPEDILSMADMAVTIPMRRRVNSLNVSVAAALVLYEARRQRASDS